MLSFLNSITRQSDNLLARQTISYDSLKATKAPPRESSTDRLDSGLDAGLALLDESIDDTIVSAEVDAHMLPYVHSNLRDRSSARRH